MLTLITREMGDDVDQTAILQQLQDSIAASDAFEDADERLTAREERMWTVDEGIDGAVMAGECVLNPWWP